MICDLKKSFIDLTDHYLFPLIILKLSSLMRVFPSPVLTIHILYCNRRVRSDTQIATKGVGNLIADFSLG